MCDVTLLECCSMQFNTLLLIGKTIVDSNNMAAFASFNCPMILASIESCTMK